MHNNGISVLQYLKHCTEILVMEKGAIVERGNHDTLMSLDGYYSGMINKFHNKDESIVGLLQGNNNMIRQHFSVNRIH